MNRSSTPTRIPAALDAVRPELDRLEPLLRDGSDLEFGLLQELLDWTFQSGGKRVRPALSFAASRVGPADPEAVMWLAASVETLHAATLVHDDFVDGAVTRRGTPTLNTRWTAAR